MKTTFPTLLAVFATWSSIMVAAETHRVDVCVYGATPSGIVAAVAAKQEGCSVLIVEPSRWVGGFSARGSSRCRTAPSR